MKVSDYIAQFLASKGVTHAFGMSGGAAVHIFDSIDKRADMDIISMTHEQCAAMAADGYARSTGKIGVAVTTSGPGATNLLTGVCCSYYDSVPVLMLTGQVATHRLKGHLKVRQVGFQETDVVAIFSPVTKYAVQVSDPQNIRFELEKAYHIAFEGRPGPVLLDIPDDLQRAEVDPSTLSSYQDENAFTFPRLDSDIDGLMKVIAQAKRPLLILGGGLKTPYVGPVLHDCLKRLGIPALVTWAGLDLLTEDDPLRVGTFGVYGPRVGNFAVQNADLIITLGTRLSQNLTGGILSSFAREATIAMVDVDEPEMSKFDGKGIKITHRIHARLTDFFAKLNPKLAQYKKPDIAAWEAKISHWRKAFPIEPKTQAPVDHRCVDAYDFVDELSGVLGKDAEIYVDTGGNLTWTCNGFRPKSGQRVHSAWNNTPMGYSLPAAIGAAFAKPHANITAIIGDGGLMVCLAELATVIRHRLPVKVILFNNHGHGIQKQTLETWLNGRYVGVHPESGLAFPSDFVAVAQAFGFETFNVREEVSMADTLKRAYAMKGPVFINVEINPNQKLYPVLKFGAALENQLPSIDELLIEKEMLVAPFRMDQGAMTKKQSSQGW